MGRNDAGVSNTLGLLVFGGSILSGALLLGLFTGSIDEVQQDARQAATTASTGLVAAVQVRGLSGERDLGGPGLGALRVYLSAAPGSAGLDLGSLAIELKTRDASALYTLGEPPEGFAWRAVIDPPPPLEGDPPLVASNDLVEVVVQTAAAGVPLPPRTEGTLSFLSPDARPERLPFRVPFTLEGRDVLELHRASPARWTFHPLGEP